MERILIIRGGAIGDFILTLPAVELLKQKWPEARVEILGYPAIAELGHQRHYFEAVRSMDHRGLSSFFIPDTILDPDWMDYFASFSLVVSYLYDPDELFASNMRKCEPGQYLPISPKVESGRPAAFHLAAPLEKLGLKLESPEARLYPSDEDKKAAADFLRATLGEEHEATFLAVHPGSGSEHKNWPLDRWARVISRHLDEQPGHVIAVSGEADTEHLPAFLQQLQEAHPGRVHGAQLPLPHVAALIQRAAGFAGHDSGISHLAAAVGAPVLALFGTTDPETWAPQGDKVRLIRSSNTGMDGIETDAVIRALSDLA